MGKTHILLFKIDNFMKTFVPSILYHRDDFNVSFCIDIMIISMVFVKWQKSIGNLQ